MGNSFSPITYYQKILVRSITTSYCLPTWRGSKAHLLDAKDSAISLTA
ncbi:hypothetical protein COO91_04003 [Nostoc flagelliforme CCNUN1]|uniref:Uncharacterized protein n=1 Tax=Nostoc flagelliforme CCNUN1 TaxID=2038116 RepID=A0A2K8SRG1_9NOSO|nr:hypothetical protein COO91_04003 [Nostoc flagelliforme CCNUN1]